MKKFAFSLEKVLTFKQQLLDVSMHELAQLQAELKSVLDEINSINQHFGDYSIKIQDELQIGISPQKTMTYKIYMASLVEQINLLTKKKIEVEEQIKNKRNEVIAMKSDISGIEKLKDKKLEEYRKAIQKMEEISIEEYVNQTCFA